MKRILVLILSLILLSSCTKKEVLVAEDNEIVHVGFLKDSGMVSLLSLYDNNLNALSRGHYTFSVYENVESLKNAIKRNEVDIAILPPTDASKIYVESDGEYEVLDICAGGNAFLCTYDSSAIGYDNIFQNQVYLAYEGSNIEYFARYVLTARGINDYEFVFFENEDELLDFIIKNPYNLAILSQPQICSLLTKNNSLNIPLNFNDEFLFLTKDVEGINSVALAKKSYVEANSKLIQIFLEEHNESIAFANGDDNTITLGRAALDFNLVNYPVELKNALPYCNLKFYQGNDLKDKLSAYLEALYSYNPYSVGGRLPEEDFYYCKN